MTKKLQQISIIGDGGWGTTLAVHLARQDRKVKLWGPFPKYVEEVTRSRINTKFLPGVKIPRHVEMTADLPDAIASADLIVLASPSQYLTGVLQQIKPCDYKGKVFLSVVKGIDTDRLVRMSEIIKEELGRVTVAVLSGPTIAGEVARGIPSTAVVACRDKAIAAQIQGIFHSDTFRIYTNTDIIGVELGGSVKNIIALACGLCDGLGFGTNTKSAIVTRGLAEMARLGKALGARGETFSGLTGIGDLVTTCFSPQSRNRSVGEQLGKGRSIKAILSSMDQVAEGVVTAKAVYRLSKKLGVAMPITQEIYRILYEGKKPKEAVADLMTREKKPE